MKKCYFLVLTIMAALFCADASAKKNAPINGTTSTPNMNTGRRLSFIENKGQVKDQNSKPRHDIQFSLAAANGLNIFIGEGAIHYQFSKADGNSSPQRSSINNKPSQMPEDILDKTRDISYTTYRMDVELMGANKQAQVITEEKQEYYENYFTTGNEKDGAVAHTYNRITYKNIYPNIDWVLYTTKGELKHEFVVHRGGNVSDIQLKYGGATKLKIDKGALLACTPQGTITEQAPYTYTKNGASVQSSFKLVNNIVSYEVGNYDGDLVIDPTLVWATYYATDVLNILYNVTTDNAGKIYLAGYASEASSIVTSGAYQTTYGGWIVDAILVVFDSSGTRLWATYYGGTLGDNGLAVAVDNSGNIYLGGATYSPTGIATPGSHQAVISLNSEGFLAKFNSAGSRLWATYYSGQQSDDIRDMTVDDSGNVYVTGYARSVTSIATPGTHKSSKAGLDDDAFIAKFDSMGTRKWGTYFGGTGQEWGLSIRFAPSGYLYLVGYTESATGIATPGAHQAVFGGLRDGFIAKFNLAGSLEWASYMGGSDDDEVHKVIVDDSGHVYIGGFTRSLSGIATSGAYDETCSVGRTDGFLSKFNSSGDIIWSTYFGGAYDDAIQGICSYGDGKIFITGNTNSLSGIATAGALKSTHGGGAQRDGFFQEFSAGGNRIWGTYYGGAETDDPRAMAAGPGGKVYVVGGTLSPTGIATTGSHVETYVSGTNGFMARFDTARLTITGTAYICNISGTSALSVNYPGGTWSSSAPAIAAVNPATGLVTGISAGIANITYMLSGGSYSTLTVTVALSGNITGATNICLGTTAIFTHPIPGGTWSSSNTAKATINAMTGLLGGVGVGTANITYTFAGGCFATIQVTVNTALTGVISGATNVCVGSSTTFTHPTPGGTWGSSNAAIASVDLSTGVVTGVSVGVATITYDVSGCIRTKNITVNAPTGASIGGTTTICEGSTTVLSYPAPGVSWTSTNPSVATIGATSGVVTALSAGTTNITFLGTSGCGSNAVVTILALPTAISGTLAFCQGTTTPLASVGTTGGTWISSAPSRASIGAATGIVTGVRSGTANITYTWTNTCRRFAQVTVNPLPAAAALVGAGTMSPTTAPTQTLAASQPGGTWASANPARATIVAGTGFMTAISAGTVVISYTRTNGCGTITNSRIFTILSPRPGIDIVGAEGGGVAFAVYPNPTSGAITVDANTTGIFTVYTIDGRQVAEYAIKDAATSLTLPSQLASGVYMCRFNGDDGSTVMVRLVYER